MKLLQGDCLEVLKELPDNSVDSLITDPPAGISFMGKSWDEDKGGRKQWVTWMSEVMVECLRVLKPGAHGLVWAIPRTSHWTASALEDAGFEIRDVVTHVFGSGFPKSMNIEKTLGDKAKGMGTALKPASEHWILVRKPISEKTVAANVLQHGTGGINIDASRIGFTNGETSIRPTGSVSMGAAAGWNNPDTKNIEGGSTVGRFPANFILSHNHDCVEMGTKNVGSGKSGMVEFSQPDIKGNNFNQSDSKHKNMGMAYGIETIAAFECAPSCAVAELDRQSGGVDKGGASRFFYVAKASKKDKGAENTHPTVKSSGLMTYLIKLITPPGGVVLDPFMGSGSTGVAASNNGFDFVGIEKEDEYYAIAEKRIK